MLKPRNFPYTNTLATIKKTKMKQAILTIIFLITIGSIYGQSDYLEKGNDYMNNGELEKAEQIFKDGIKSEPENLIFQCQLGLTLIQQKEFKKAEKVLDKVLKTDPNNVAAIWYSGIGNFKAGEDRKAIERFEKALTLLDKNSGQYYSANWFIGKGYSILLKTEGLTYDETDRMFECYDEYLRLQPNAKDAVEIKEYVERKKKRRPSDNVKKWIDL
jgi:tetratricopeptide (TPR) repeat protein